MKAIHSIIAVLALAFVFPAAATAAVGDPELILYRVSGVNANGGPTEISCTPFSGVTENIRIVTRDNTGTIVNNSVLPLAHLNTTVFSTGNSTPGTAAIAATSNQVVCSAGTNGVLTLRMIRFNPISGTTE
jgi:hypothetical protein